MGFERENTLLGHPRSHLAPGHVLKSVEHVGLITFQYK